MENASIHLHERIARYKDAVKWKYDTFGCYPNDGRIFIKQAGFTKEGFLQRFKDTAVIVGIVVFILQIFAVFIGVTGTYDINIIDIGISSIINGLLWGSLIAAILEFFNGSKDVFLTDSVLDQVLEEYECKSSDMKNDVSRQLKEYKKLIDEGLITEIEYQKCKERLLGIYDPSKTA